MFDRRWRSDVERGLQPVGSTLRRTGLSADQLTVVGLLLAGAAAVAIGSGRLGLGLGLLIASAIPDLLDGAVAKASQTASPRGAFFDSVVDRVADALVLGGVAWYLSRTHSGAIVVLPFAVAAAASLVSYERARAESLGYTAKGGLMERAERVVMLCFGLAFSSVLIPLLWIMLVLTLITVGQRFVMVWRQASVARPARQLSPARLRARDWRERRAGRPRTRGRRSSERSEPTTGPERPERGGWRHRGTRTR